jgi:hypothetical protein
MKYCKKTNKLFYDKFVNKISFDTPVALLFRNRQDVAVLLEFFEDYRRRINNTKSGNIEVGKSWRPIKLNLSQLEFIEKVVKLLMKETDFGIRVENYSVSVYTNSDSLLDKIEELSPDNIREISKPVDEKIKGYLINNPYKIILNSYEYKFKVTYNPLKENTESFKQWCQSMPKIKLLKIHPSLEGYFYVSDSKVLGLCRLFLGNKIRRVDENVTVDEI